MSDMSELNLIESLAASIAERVQAAAIPLEVDLWDIPKLAAYFKRSPQVVRQSIVCIPSFPKAIRLPTAVRAQPLWNAMEVIEWARKHKEKN